ncbi:helix-turn-helix domain-containing protein [Streptomyces nanshensis]|uniref:Cro/Cl family transcriptional regulator n=1 Tax=Streptomyces nanshensis TaxID=518642 RepID=A0A1E7KZ63_9ACTN|nr:helix-turn-helix transcriptional regulator [Streptomyces nanshensis]OEV09212.1 Cro/Cl family transcriptional regulator [Streptomyces nanshensis]
MPPEEEHRIRVHLDEMLEKREITLTDLAKQVNIKLSNLSEFKTGKKRAIRFTALTALCRALDCQPGDLLTYEPEEVPLDMPGRE